jgi:hypothetical protein
MKFERAGDVHVRKEVDQLSIRYLSAKGPQRVA